MNTGISLALLACMILFHCALSASAPTPQITTAPSAQNMSKIPKSGNDAASVDSCEVIPGIIPADANGNGLVEIGDCVYIINYVFKGGPEPIPYPIYSCDAYGECTCNVGCAVHIIGYIFKGAPAPISCEEWLTNCGPPIR